MSLSEKQSMTSTAAQSSSDSLLRCASSSLLERLKYSLWSLGIDAWKERRTFLFDYQTILTGDRRWVQTMLAYVLQARYKRGHGLNPSPYSYPAILYQIEVSLWTRFPLCVTIFIGAVRHTNPPPRLMAC